jgi:hypothetical protein
MIFHIKFHDGGSELFQVGNGFEGFHGGSPFVDTKKPADPGGRAGARGEPKGA